MKYTLEHNPAYSEWRNIYEVHLSFLPVENIAMEI